MVYKVLVMVGRWQ